MNNPKLWVMLRKADGETVTCRISRVEGYTNDNIQGFAGFYDLSSKDKRRFRKAEQYVFFTDNYKIENVDGRNVIGQKEGSCGAVAVFGSSSNAPGENYAVLMRTNAFAEAYRSLKGDFKLPFKMIIVVIVILVVMLLGLNYLRGGSEVPVNGGEVAPIEDSIKPSEVD